MARESRRLRRLKPLSSTLREYSLRKFGMSEIGAGPMVGIVFGVLLIILGVIAGIWWLCKRSHSSQGHVITLCQADPKQQPSVYTHQPSGYQQQQIGYQQQQTCYSQQPAGYPQQKTSYPQLPTINNHDVDNADLEVSSAFSAPRAALGRTVAQPTGTLNVSSALAPPALPSRSPSPFSPMRPPHELYD